MTSEPDTQANKDRLLNNISLIPTDLTQTNKWAVYRAVNSRKVPWRLDGVGKLRWSNSLNLTDFEDALDVYTQGLKLAANNGQRFAGIGYVLPIGSETPRLVAVDLDGCINDAGEIRKGAKAILDKLSSYTERSPSGNGLHVWVKATLPKDYKNISKIDGGAALDLNGQNVEVFVRSHFVTVTGDRLNEYPAEIQDRTDEILAIYDLQGESGSAREREGSRQESRIQKYAETALQREAAEVRGTRPGQRNSRLNKAAYSIGGYVGAGVLDERDAEAELERAARYSGLEPDEIGPTIKSGLEAGKHKPRDVPELQITPRPRIAVELDHTSIIDGEPGRRKLNEPNIASQVLGNTLLLKIEEQEESYAVYDSGRFVTGKQAKNRIDQTVQQIVANVDDKIDEDIMKLLTRSVRGNVWGHISGTAKLISTGQFDPYNDLVCCTNGVINLRTGELLEHAQAYFMRSMLGVEYNPNAEAPLFLEFMERIQPDREKRDYLQRLLGSLLSGDRKEQAFYIWWGEKDNGKSVLAKTVSHVLGEYAFTAPTKAFLVHQHEPLLPELAQMASARAVIVGELPRGRNWNEPLIKAMTAGDTISARLLHQHAFSYTPKYKIVMHTNHIPTTETLSPSLMKRMRLIGFDEIIPPEEQDEELPDKLKAEASGILAWMVEGCNQWYKDGMGQPAWMEEDIESYKTATDPLCGFPEDCLVKRVGSSIQASTMYQMYQSYCREQGEEPLSNKEFAAKMMDRHYKKSKSMGKQFYRNVAPRGEEQQKLPRGGN